MTWPKDSHIACYGFSKDYLYAIKQAIDNKLVVWGRSSGICGAISCEFTWAECKWEIEELNEYVTGFKLLEGEIDPETLTAALLGPIIETS